MRKWREGGREGREGGGEWKIVQCMLLENEFDHDKNSWCHAWVLYSAICDRARPLRYIL